MASNDIFSGGNGLFGASPWQQAMGAASLGSLFGGLYNDAGAPYGQAMDQYQKWANQAQGYQNPFFQAGSGAIPQYQDWLKNMSNPSGFINNLMGQYQESPWAKFQQQQAVRSAQNMGSAAGLGGSTPLTQFAQQNAQNISSQDMNQWLQNVLGINTQYGSGLSGLMQGGQGAANSLTGLYSNLGQQMGQAAYGQEAGDQSNFSNLLGGGLSLASLFL